MSDHTRAIDPDEHEALLQFLYLAPVGLVSTTLDGSVTMLNPLSAQLLMPVAPHGELSNLFDALEGVAPELRSLAADFRQPRGSICDNHRAQLTAGVKGQEDPRYLGITLIKLDEQRLMAVLNDISQLVKQERLLHQGEAWFNAILTGVKGYALMNVDEQGRIESWNEGVERLTGHDQAAVLGRPFSVFYPKGGLMPEHVLDRLHEADANGWSLAEGWQLRVDGSRFWGSAMIAPLDAPADMPPPRSYALILRDTSDKREAIAELQRSVAEDHLTGLPNRRTFFQAAERELARYKRHPRPLSLVMFDCDHFKAINDAHGHPGGDQVLRHFAGKLREVCREVDLIARIGGEEFVALLPSTDAAGAVAFAERLRQAVEAAVVQIDGHEVRYTVSAGVCAIGTEPLELDAWIKRADAGLYAAKRGGRNRVELVAPH